MQPPKSIPNGNLKTLIQLYQAFWDLQPRIKRNVTVAICLVIILAINFIYLLDLQEKYKAPEPISGKRVLVTGAAGFIGFHLSKQLNAYNNKVVGLDSFNDYYDQELKYTRANILRKEYQIEVIDGNICDKKLLQDMFRKYEFTHIAHLAAQAGVRYSLQNPQSYVTNNIMCSTILFEVVREINPNIVVVYASSSSVYGRNTKIPFSEKDPVNHPSNVYGASKRANEQWALVYHDLFGIKVTGLRFFTVYGPFGRPDMAIYLWSNAISKDEPIPLYEKKDASGRNIVIMRDFTYVDDIVDGIIGSLSLGAELEVFNLGNNTPEPIVNLIDYLGKELGRPNPKTQLKPLPKADITMTYADISHAKKRLGFHPRTKLNDGVKSFVSWYQSYYFPTNIVFLFVENVDDFKKWYSINGDHASKNTHIYILHDSEFPLEIIKSYTSLQIRFRKVDKVDQPTLSKQMKQIAEDMIHNCPKEQWKLKRVAAYYSTSGYSSLYTEQALYQPHDLILKRGPNPDNEDNCRIEFTTPVSSKQIAGDSLLFLDIMKQASGMTSCFGVQWNNYISQQKFQGKIRIV